MTRELKRGIHILKYYPIILNAYILVIMIGSILGFSTPQLYTVMGQCFILNIMCYNFSKVFQFCFWHRILIISASSVLLLETLTLVGVEINYYCYICSAIVVLLSFVSTILYYKYGCYLQKPCKDT